MYEIKLTGSPRERGLLHGAEFKVQIKELLEIRKNLLKKKLPQHSQEDINAIADLQLKALEKHPDLCEEFKALAEAAEISKVDLMILNNYTDIRDFVNFKGGEPLDDGCTVYYAKNETATLAGQTWDMHASATPYVLKMSIEEESSYKAEILTVVGCLGLAGVSNKGLGVFINNLHTKEVGAGLFWSAYVRKLLQFSKASEAAAYFEEALPSSGRNFLIADKDEAFLIENTGQNFEKIGVVLSSEQEGFLFHTNHYVGSLVEKENLERRSSTTLNRYQAAKDYFEHCELDALNVERLGQGLLSGAPGAVLCIPQPEDPAGTATCGGLIYDLKNHQGHSFKGTYDENQFQQIDI